MDDKLKHLEFIQQIIERMTKNSFVIKGWSVTIVSAIIALAAKDANPHFVLISYVSTPIFWWLDGYFIAQERKYRCLFYEVANKQGPTDFSLDASKFRESKNSIPSGMFSIAVWPIFISLIAIVLLVMFAFPTIENR